MAVTLEFSTLPYPGLRPFRYDESDIFFGREAQTDQLLERLGRNHFLAVTGPSGCGKSSLIKAGMIPALSAGFMVEGGSRWRICELRPGDRPLSRLARILGSADILGADRTGPESIALSEATLRRGPLGLIEIVRSAEALKDANLLVVVDQFEEIFRYRDRIVADEADAFVALLLASARQTEVAIYVVITMRSDYIGDCAMFHGLPEAVSAAQYLTPRLTREDLELAIAGPARVFGGRVEPRLVNRLINDFGTDPDQLPLLQHVLARLWDIASPKPPVLTVEDYQEIGGLSAALSNHGDEILAGLSPEQQRIAEIMFRRLSGTQDGRLDVRAPARVDEIARIAGVECEAVIAIADAFRRPDRCFLATPEGPLDENTLLDLSHESLIRQWRRLADWVDDEAKSTELYQRLRDWALRWEQGNAGLWRGPDLANAAAWREREAPSEAWAQRYGGRDQFRLAMKFLDAGEEAQRAAAAADEAKRQQQLRRVRRVAWGFGGATVTLASAILFYSIAFVRDHVVYYKDGVEKFGVLQGIGPLSAADVAHRSASYRFTTQGVLGPVLKVEQVNSAGRLGFGLTGLLAAAGGKPEKEFRLEYAYDAQGRVAGEVALDRRDQRIRTTIYSPSDPRPRDSRTAYVIGPDGSLAPEKRSCATFVAYDYSSEGYVTKTHYYDRNGNPTPGKDGAFIKEAKREKFGRVIESTSLWKDGRPMNDINGNAGTRRFYDDQGNLVKSENIDATGNPIEPKGGVYRATMSYDNRGNWVEGYLQHANEDSSLIFEMCKILRRKVDERGNPIEAYCVRRDGELSKTGFAISKNQFDDDDQMVGSTYFDRDGHPVLGPNAAFREPVSYDRDGNITEYAAFGTDDRPIVNKHGFHKKISEFKNEHAVRTEYRDVDGRLIALGEGFAAVSREYDTQGNETLTTYLGVDDQPVINRTEGYAIKSVSYDTCGREIESKFFDEVKHPIRSKKGYAGIRQSYDEDNNVKEEVYFDEKNQPGRSIGGYARVIREFDRNRNVIAEQYFDAQGKPFLLKGAYAEHKSRYDDHNDLVEEAYLGPVGEPVAGDKGGAKHTKRYDEHNALVEEAWFGPDGQPVLNDEGWARLTTVNDAYGRDLETAWFGIDGKPVMLKNGYAKRTRRYDDDGNAVEEAYFGTDGEPIVSEDGYARITKRYDALGHITGWAHFGVRGEKVIGTKEDYHRAEVVPDERGNRLEFAAFGLDGKPVLYKDGYFRWVDRYDAHNHLVEQAFYGIDNEPAVNTSAGNARLIQTFNTRGKVIEVALFGTDGRPILGKNGYAKRTDRYNDYGDLVEEAYFGTDGEPVAEDDGYARLGRVVDGDGRVVQEAYFGTDGKPVIAKGGFAKGVLRYDDLGREIERFYYGVSGEPIIGKDDNAYYRGTRKLDSRGNVLEFATFGVDDKPIEVVDSASGRRCAKLVKRFDGNNKQIDAQCFDAAGTPVPAQ
jgi:hypothetical protein